MTKKTLYIALRKPSKKGFAVFNKRPSEPWETLAKVELTPKIIEKYDKKLTAKQIYEILRRELRLVDWN